MNGREGTGNRCERGRVQTPVKGALSACVAVPRSSGHLLSGRDQVRQQPSYPAHFSFLLQPLRILSMPFTLCHSILEHPGWRLGILHLRPLLRPRHLHRTWCRAGAQYRPLNEVTKICRLKGTSPRSICGSPNPRAQNGADLGEGDI